MNIFTSSRFSRMAAALLVATILFSSTVQLRAQTVVSNLGQTLSGSVGYIGNHSGSGVQHSVWSFTTGGTAASFDFTGITVLFSNANGSPANLLTVGLYSAFDTTAGPSGSLASLSLSTGNPLITGAASFTGSTVSLAANTSYFLAFNDDAEAPGNTYNFALAASGSEDSGGLAGWVIADTYNFAPYTSTWGTVGASPMFSVQATAVPEPSTYAAFAGLAVLGLTCWRRRRS